MFQIISAELKQTEGWVLTTEGVEMAKNGSHEFNVFTAIKKEGLLQADLQVRIHLFLESMTMNLIQ